MNDIKKAIILLSIITSVVFIGVVILLFKSPIPSEKDVLKIEILNGTTGDSIIFTTNEKDEILKKFRTLKTRVSGIASWSCGYTYKVTFIMKEQKKDILIRSHDYFSSGHFRYKTDSDIIKIIEEIIK